MIGIIGYGRFGQLMAAYLADDFKVVAYRRSQTPADCRNPNTPHAPLEKVAQQDIVIIAVPISTLKETLQRIAPMLKKDALIVDVCSVKEYPLQWMEDILPETVSILGTHPMFGPDSAGDSLEGCKIVLCRARISERVFAAIKTYLSAKGLIVIEATPQEHDKQIAVSLALTHFIGRSLSEFGADPLPIDTEGYKRLLHILDVVEHDTWQLFLDMNQFNPYADEVRSSFMQAIEKTDKRLKIEVKL